MKLALYFQHRIAAATLVVLVVLLGLSFTFELIDEIGNSSGGYGFAQALVYSAMQAPEASVRDLPLMGLIGALVGLGSLASSSEIIAARAAGWSLTRIVALTAVPGFVLGLFGVAVAQFIVPFSSVTAENYKSIAQGRGELNESVRGLWHRLPDGYMSLGSVNSRGEASRLNWFEFTPEHELVEAGEAPRGEIASLNWRALDSTRVQVEQNQIRQRVQDTRVFPIELGASELSLAQVDPSFLPPLSLWKLSQQLKADGLNAQRPQLYLYQTVFLPLSVVCLVLAAVGFVLGPLRSSPIGTRLFIGVLVGLGFKLVQDVAGPVALVYGTHPSLAVGLPAALALILAAAMFRRV